MAAAGVAEDTAIVYVGPALRYWRAVKETVFNVNVIPVIVARFITKLPVTAPNV